MRGFTPGPWRAEWDDNGRWYVEPLGLSGSGLRGDSKDCVEASNARLIAAAPRMYEALKTIHEWIIDVNGPIDREDLWHPAFVKAHDLTEAVLTEIEGKSNVKA